MTRQLTDLMVLTGVCAWGYVAYLGILSLITNTLTC